uniref:C2H2-type domain-containing protein n=1 Tax=Anopheles atroparvus TaxID=41427 RepID=A0AAG5DDL7_ANOAO
MTCASKKPTIADARQHCDALIKEEIDETPRSDDGAGGGGRQGRAEQEQNGLDCSTTNRSQGGQVYLLPCPLCEVPLEPRVFRQHLDRHYPRDSPVCPVIQCGRRFAHPNSVRNHMRLKHTNQWAQMKAMRSSGGPFTGIP